MILLITLLVFLITIVRDLIYTLTVHTLFDNLESHSYVLELVDMCKDSPLLFAGVTSYKGSLQQVVRCSNSITCSVCTFVTEEGD